jgi:hypothetical protein
MVVAALSTSRPGCAVVSLPHPPLRPTRRQERWAQALAIDSGVLDAVSSLTHYTLPTGSVLDALTSYAHQSPIALERVVYPCSSMNCGDVIYRR